MAPLVDNEQIQSAELLRPLPLYQHAYIWPFAIIWPVFLRYYLTPELYEKYIQAQEWTFVWVITIVTCQALVWLCTHWSVNLRAAFTAKKARSVDDALLIKVIPAANAGSADICKLERTKVSPRTHAKGLEGEKKKKVEGPIRFRKWQKLTDQCVPGR